jgi:cytochrome c oxidase subunit II
VGVQLPRRPGTSWARLALAVSIGAGVVTLAGCSSETQDEWKRMAMPEPGTDQGIKILDFWQNSWIAALATGVVVWALMLWAVWRYRRRHEDDVPVQTRYNLPLEIFYTIAPVIMVLVFFTHTVRLQTDLKELSPDPDHTIEVVGQQWSWTFNYVDEPVADGKNVYESGTASYVPTLVLPVDESIRFKLVSPDVIHSFWIISFLYKEDVIPGRINEFEVTPNRIGDFKGKCAELCGTYHSRMLFNVRVVSREDYEQYLQQQIDKGFVSDSPVTGNMITTEQAGLETEGGTE